MVVDRVLDADPDQLTREALETFLSRNSIKGDLVAMSIAGQSGLARFVKLPPVEEKKIADIVRFEAKQQIPFPLDEVVWDFQKIGAGIVTDGFAMDTEVGLFAMKREAVTKAMQQRDLTIACDLHNGNGEATMLFTDLSHAYVDENMGTS